MSIKEWIRKLPTWLNKYGPAWLQAIGVTIGAVLLAALQHNQAELHKKLEINGQLFPFAVEILKAPPKDGEEGWRTWAMDVFMSVSKSLDHEVSDDLIDKLQSEPLPLLRMQRFSFDTECSPPPSNPQLCYSSGLSTTIRTEGQLWVQITPAQTLCHPVVYSIQLDDVRTVYSDVYEPGASEPLPPIGFGGLQPGSYTLKLNVEGRPGGCSEDGSIKKLDATVDVTVS